MLIQAPLKLLWMLSAGLLMGLQPFCGSRQLFAGWFLLTGVSLLFAANTASSSLQACEAELLHRVVRQLGVLASIGVSGGVASRL